MSTSGTQAITIDGPGHASINTVSLPKLRDGYMLVRTTAFAVNPTDWKGVDMSSESLVGARVGCDYAGVVEEVGAGVTKAFAKGDRVCGMAHGSNAVQPENGAFAEYIVAKGDVAIKIPDNLSDEQAATLGVGIATTGQALYQSMKLPPPAAPFPSPVPILVYGGSTASGMLAIQLAKLSGCAVATTCSPPNFDYLRELGADLVLDRWSPTVAADVAAWARGLRPQHGLRHVLDCIATPDGDTVRVCVDAMADNDEARKEPGRYCALLFLLPEQVELIKSKGADYATTVAYTQFGETFKFHGAEWPASDEDFEFAKAWWETARELLAQGKLRPARIDLNRGGKKGLKGVLVGLEEGREGKISGVKLVYSM